MLSTFHTLFSSSGSIATTTFSFVERHRAVASFDACGSGVMAAHGRDSVIDLDRQSKLKGWSDVEFCVEVGVDEDDVRRIDFGRLEIMRRTASRPRLQLCATGSDWGCDWLGIESPLNGPENSHNRILTFQEKSAIDLVCAADFFRGIEWVTIPLTSTKFEICDGVLQVASKGYKERMKIYVCLGSGNRIEHTWVFHPEYIPTTRKDVVNLLKYEAKNGRKSVPGHAQCFLDFLLMDKYEWLVSAPFNHMHGDKYHCTIAPRVGKQWHIFVAMVPAGKGFKWGPHHLRIRSIAGDMLRKDLLPGVRGPRAAEGASPPRVLVTPTEAYLKHLVAQLDRKLNPDKSVHKALFDGNESEVATEDELTVNSDEFYQWGGPELDEAVINAFPDFDGVDVTEFILAAPPKEQSAALTGPEEDELLPPGREVGPEPGDSLSPAMLSLRVSDVSSANELTDAADEVLVVSADP